MGWRGEVPEGVVFEGEGPGEVGKRGGEAGVWGGAGLAGWAGGMMRGTWGVGMVVVVSLVTAAATWVGEG